MNKKKRKLKSWPIVLLFFSITLGILIYCIIDIKNSLTNNGGAKKVEVVDSISTYGYEINENDSKYVQKLFSSLKKELEKDIFDNEKYAKLVSQIFLADFFSLNSTINKNDVGGMQFIYKPYQETFLKYAKDTVYKNVENNIYKDRTQELPMVTSVEITDVRKEKYTSKVNSTTDDEAFYISLKITYEKDLEYQTVANLVLVHNDKKLEIVSME